MVNFNSCKTEPHCYVGGWPSALGTNCAPQALARPTCAASRALPRWHVRLSDHQQPRQTPWETWNLTRALCFMAPWSPPQTRLGGARDLSARTSRTPLPQRRAYWHSRLADTRPSTPCSWTSGSRFNWHEAAGTMSFCWAPRLPSAPCCMKWLGAWQAQAMGRASRWAYNNS